MIYTQPHRQQRTVGIPMSRKPRLTPEEVARQAIVLQQEREANTAEKGCPFLENLTESDQRIIDLCKGRNKGLQESIAKALRDALPKILGQDENSRPAKRCSSPLSKGTQHFTHS